MVWMPRRQDLIDFVAAELRVGDVCISMGCGDIATFPAEVIERRADLASTWDQSTGRGAGS
jgi:UDP-N-acetylmuramate--alanine ligase